MGQKVRHLQTRFAPIRAVWQMWHMDLNDNGQRAIFVATVNAVMRSLNRISGTIHCRDAGPAECASHIGAYIRQQYGAPKIGMAGFQPALIRALGSEFALRVLDLDPDNIGTHRHGVRIEGGDATPEVLAWADVLLVTGTTLANDSIDLFLGAKPVLFLAPPLPEQPSSWAGSGIAHAARKGLGRVTA